MPEAARWCLSWLPTKDKLHSERLYGNSPTPARGGPADQRAATAEPEPFPPRRGSRSRYSACQARRRPEVHRERVQALSDRTDPPAGHSAEAGQPVSGGRLNGRTRQRRSQARRAALEFVPASPRGLREPTPPAERRARMNRFGSVRQACAAGPVYVAELGSRLGYDDGGRFWSNPPMPGGWLGDERR